MRELTLVRHAKSSWKDAGQQDFDRPLNKRGERDAPAMGRRLLAWPSRPTLVVASPARRAEQTLEALVAEWQPPPAVVWEPELYLASAERLLDAVRALDPAHAHAALLGHNPGLSDFAHRFSDTRIDDLPTCGVLRLRLEVAEWRDARWGCAALEDFVTPKSRRGA